MLETGCFESHLVAEIVKEIILGSTHLKHLDGLVSPSTHILAHISAIMMCITQTRTFLQNSMCKKIT